MENWKPGFEQLSRGKVKMLNLESLVEKRSFWNSSVLVFVKTLVWKGFILNFCKSLVENVRFRRHRSQFLRKSRGKTFWKSSISVSRPRLYFFFTLVLLDFCCLCCFCFWSLIGFLDLLDLWQEKKHSVGFGDDLKTRFSQHFLAFMWDHWHSHPPTETRVGWTAHRSNSGVLLVGPTMFCDSLWDSFASLGLSDQNWVWTFR